MRYQNPNSILILYEGDTEEEFYKRIISLKIPKRSIRISYDNLKGISTNINNKVLARINKHLTNNPDKNLIHVFICIDREGGRNLESPVDIGHIMNNLSNNAHRIPAIYEIIATQDLESWFFIDIEGIYGFLRVPGVQRNSKKYANYEAFNHRDLSKLFRKHNRVYSKGNKVEGLLEALNMDQIYNECSDLKNGLQRILDLL